MGLVECREEDCRGCDAADDQRSEEAGVGGRAEADQVVVMVERESKVLRKEDCVVESQDLRSVEILKKKHRSIRRIS